MKPKGGAKCSRRSHSLWVKWAPSRKRVRLGRKIFFSHGELEALIFRESGQVYVQEDVSGKGGALKIHQAEAGLGTISQRLATIRLRLDWALQSCPSFLFHSEPHVWLANSPHLGPPWPQKTVLLSP